MTIVQPSVYPTMGEAMFVGRIRLGGGAAEGFISSATPFAASFKRFAICKPMALMGGCLEMRKGTARALGCRVEAGPPRRYLAMAVEISADTWSNAPCNSPETAFSDAIIVMATRTAIRPY